MKETQKTRVKLLIKIYLKYVVTDKLVTAKQIAEWINSDYFGLQTSVTGAQISSIITRNYSKNDYFRGVLIDKSGHTMQYRWVE